MCSRSAEVHGLLGYPVIIYFKNSAHAVVGFPTCDQGFVIMEPQTGERIFPRVGKVLDDERIWGIYVLRLKFKRISLDNSPKLGNVLLPFSCNANTVEEKSIFSIQKPFIEEN